MNDFTEAADALAEIERTQQRAYADQRLPVWHVPSVVLVGSAVGVGTELDGMPRTLLMTAAAVGLTTLTLMLSARTRIKFRPRTWTPQAGALMALWITSIFVIWGVVPLAAGAFTDSGVWQKTLAGLVTAGYTAATTRWAEDLVRARLAGKVVR
ncbi:hypothetical protein [Actinomadura chokoriensis]|uniref:Holin n=1 Tax=Actinomadura chokoriensis TaxID=454156 RepID=A0ABV4QVT5_9ACTN